MLVLLTIVETDEFESAKPLIEYIDGLGKCGAGVSAVNFVWAAHYIHRSSHPSSGLTSTHAGHFVGEVGTAGSTRR